MGKAIQAGLGSPTVIILESIRPIAIVELDLDLRQIKKMIAHRMIQQSDLVQHVHVARQPVKMQALETYVCRPNALKAIEMLDSWGCSMVDSCLHANKHISQEYS